MLYSDADVSFLKAELLQAMPAVEFNVGLFASGHGIGIGWEIYLDDTRHRHGVALKDSTLETKDRDLANLLSRALYKRNNHLKGIY